LTRNSLVANTLMVVNIAGRLAGVDIDKKRSWLIPVEFAPARCGWFRVGLNSRTWLRFADARQYRRASALRHQEQRLHGGLPFRQGMFRLGQLGSVLGSISEGDERRKTRSLKRT
jgi:hypothetical protein